METVDAIRQAAKQSDTLLTHIGLRMGKSENYFSALASRGSVPKADTLANIARVCGYDLALVPHRSLPDDAIVIDPPG